ncbi:hypothetical protein MUK42_07058 [Musa troglodytarum]|uniref:Uncharacterized protein n=1 Tax=Musa troglodytarum TaxID=320322 RepID=A0A9E7H263_9LILI|nr:hypothetical protein MUK42_07058 [Musa troglodytarum]
MPGGGGAVAGASLRGARGAGGPRASSVAETRPSRPPTSSSPLGVAPTTASTGTLYSSSISRPPPAAIRVEEERHAVKNQVEELLGSKASPSVINNDSGAGSAVLLNITVREGHKRMEYCGFCSITCISDASSFARVRMDPLFEKIKVEAKKAPLAQDQAMGMDATVAHHSHQFEEQLWSWSPGSEVAAACNPRKRQKVGFKALSGYVMDKWSPWTLRLVQEKTIPAFNFEFLPTVAPSTFLSTSNLYSIHCSNPFEYVFW